MFMPEPHWQWVAELHPQPNSWALPPKRTPLSAVAKPSLLISPQSLLYTSIHYFLSNTDLVYNICKMHKGIKERI